MTLPFSLPHTLWFNFEFSTPTREGILVDRYQKKLNKLPDQCTYHQIATALSVLNRDDYVIFHSPTGSEDSIQYSKKDTDIIFDFIIPIADWHRCHLFWRARYGLEKLGFSDKTKPFFGLLSNLKYYYTWEDDSSGRSIQAHCDTDLKLATKVGMQLLSEIYQLSPPFSIQVEFGSYRENIFSKTTRQVIHAVNVIYHQVMFSLTRFYPFSLCMTHRSGHFQYNHLRSIMVKFLSEADTHNIDLNLKLIETDHHLANFFVSSPDKINTLRIRNTLTKIINSVLDGQTQGFVISTKNDHQLKIIFPIFFDGQQFIIGQE